MLDFGRIRKDDGAQCATRLTMLMKKFSKVDYVLDVGHSLSEIVRD